MRGMHPLALIESRTVTDSFRPTPSAPIHNVASTTTDAVARRRRRTPVAQIAGRAAAAFATLR
jgi:hypothetical protein